MFMEGGILRRLEVLTGAASDFLLRQALLARHPPEGQNPDCSPAAHHASVEPEQAVGASEG